MPAAALCFIVSHNFQRQEKGTALVCFYKGDLYLFQVSPVDLLSTCWEDHRITAIHSDKSCFILFGDGLASPDVLERWEQIIFFGKKEILDGIDENNFKQENYSIWYSQNVTIFFNKDFLTFIYFWEKETERKQERVREREGDTELEAGSRLGTVTTEPPKRGSNSGVVRSCPELKSDA